MGKVSSFVFNVSLGLVAWVATLAIAIAIAIAPNTAQAGELALAPKLMRELNAVLGESVYLHQALVTQDDEQTEISISEMLYRVNRALIISAIAKPYERRHLLKILVTARENLEMARSSYGEERRRRLIDVFTQAVNVARTYNVSRVFTIFFCPKDKTTWLQTEMKPANPFHHNSAHESCGIAVPKTPKKK